MTFKRNMFIQPPKFVPVFLEMTANTFPVHVTINKYVNASQISQDKLEIFTLPDDLGVKETSV